MSLDMAADIATIIATAIGTFAAIYAFKQYEPPRKADLSAALGFWRIKGKRSLIVTNRGNVLAKNVSLRIIDERIEKRPRGTGALLGSRGRVVYVGLLGDIAPGESRVLGASRTSFVYPALVALDIGHSVEGSRKRWKQKRVRLEREYMLVAEEIPYLADTTADYNELDLWEKGNADFFREHHWLFLVKLRLDAIYFHAKRARERFQ